MGCIFDIKTERNHTFASVAGYDGPVRTLFVPSETVEHIPVEEIAGRAFASHPDLEEVILPDSVRCLRPFAFYNCAHLHYVKLSDQVVDYYDGALRQCTELEEIELHFHTPGNVRLLKELIGDSDAALPVTLYLPTGDMAVLTFPSYADNYQEDTMARAIHEHIEGAGYATRQLVSRTGIDFQGYDRQFPRFTYDEPASAVNAAFGRLMAPYRLESAYRAQYEEYLRKESPTILPRLLRAEREERFGPEGELRWIPQNRARSDERFRFMMDQQLILEEAIQSALDVCTELQDAAHAALLMEYHRTHFALYTAAGPELFEL